MDNRKVVIVAADLISSYGKGIECCWSGMLGRKNTAVEVDRFSTANCCSDLAAMVPGLKPVSGLSLIEQMLDSLELSVIPELRDDAWLFLATTVGEIDLLENSLLSGHENVSAASQLNLLNKCLQRYKINDGRLISAACASATVALSKAAAMIATARIPCALVVAADCVSEFVFSGFSALGAMSAEVAKPFDLHRSGLTLGEAAGGLVLMDANLAAQYDIPVLATISGWGMSCDAKHMTAPDAGGRSLTNAINLALSRANMNCNNIGGIMAHGTGTVYNDAMELEALRNAFADNSRPMFSAKFGTGHTLGAAGMVQAALALKALDCDIMPGQGNLNEPMPGGDGWVATEARPLTIPNLLSVNAGFGGINAALIIESGVKS